MPDLREQLQNSLHGRVCLVGVGNVDHCDDGFGVRLADTLVTAQVQDVISAGSTPEHYIGLVAEQGFDHVVFLDAVEFGDSPGSTIFMQIGELASRFPQIAAHKMSLTMLARWVESNGKTRAWLLGVQPESVKFGSQLTPTAQRTLDVLTELLSTFQLPEAKPLARIAQE